MSPELPGVENLNVFSVPGQIKEFISYISVHLGFCHLSRLQVGQTTPTSSPEIFFFPQRTIINWLINVRITCDSFLFFYLEMKLMQHLIINNTISWFQLSWSYHIKKLQQQFPQRILVWWDIFLGTRNELCLPAVMRKTEPVLRPLHYLLLDKEETADWKSGPWMHRESQSTWLLTPRTGWKTEISSLLREGIFPSNFWKQLHKQACF